VRVERDEEGILSLPPGEDLQVVVDAEVPVGSQVAFELVGSKQRVACV
jgi:hypothetical protein